MVGMGWNMHADGLIAGHTGAEATAALAGAICLCFEIA